MNSGMRIILVLVVAVAVIGGRYLLQPGNSGNSNVVGVKANDPRMAAAIAEARQRWPDFVAAFNEHKPGRVCAVKGPFPIKGGTAEHMWIQVESIDAQSVRGTLLDDPLEDVGLKKGDTASVKVSEVEDWIYNTDKGLIGAFSQKVLDEIQPTGK